MRTLFLFMLVSILALAYMFVCSNYDKAIEQIQRDQVLIDSLQTANKQLAEEVKLEKARADIAETELALAKKSSVDPAEAITQTAYGSVKRLTPGVDATLCVSAWNSTSEHVTVFLCKTPSANEPRCNVRVTRIVDARGDQLISQSDVGCDKYDEMVTNIAKKQHTD